MDNASDAPCETEATVRLSFLKNGAPMHIYYLPSAPAENLYRAESVSVYLSESLCEPVLVDLLSGEVFDLPAHESRGGLAAYRGLPLANYPMVLTERSALSVEE